MKIRTKLALTFILLMIFGVTAVSSFSIMYIRAFLLEQGVEDMVKDARLISHALQHIDSYDDLEDDDGFSGAEPYHLQIYSDKGDVVYPGSAERQSDENIPGYVVQYFKQHDEKIMLDEYREDDRIAVFGKLDSGIVTDGWFGISKDEDILYEPVATVRWIIYTGMFISIGLILGVSAFVAREVSRPILQLSKDAKRIASGDINYSIDMNRKDEFGDLANSVNLLSYHLKADNERLLEINEKQRQFFADIAHEVRNPLHTMMGSLEMLEIDKLDTETRKKYVANARGQAKRLNQLFKDIMTLQGYDSDQNFIKPVTFDLSELVPQVCNWYQHIADENNTELTWDEHSCNVVADKDKIEQVFSNLISNALKFTSGGKVEVRYDQKEQNEVTVEVIDTGIGIPEEHQERLFDRFYRTDKARSRDKGGTGLGLSVVKSILDAHGKDMNLESKSGEGSRFYFKLDKA